MKVLELSILKSADFVVSFFLPTVTVARYFPSALIAVATVVIRQDPLLDEFVLSGVTFHACPSNELIEILALLAGLTCP
jgi:hypothetical protein